MRFYSCHQILFLTKFVDLRSLASSELPSKSFLFNVPTDGDVVAIDIAGLGEGKVNVADSSIDER
jgi:hypothetical protein